MPKVPVSFKAVSRGQERSGMGKQAFRKHQVRSFRGHVAFIRARMINLNLVEWLINDQAQKECDDDYKS